MVRNQGMKMTKHHTPLAGSRPQFNSGSFQSTAKKVRVTGKIIKALGNAPLRTLNYESRPAKNGRTNNMVYQVDCECPYGTAMPSQDTLEKAANAFLYGGMQAAATKNARNFHDNPANRCPHCHVLMPRTRVCDFCQ
jgi:hypothetical protein